MPVVNFTDRFLRTLKPGTSAVEWFDEDTRGLSLKLNPGGAATWYFNYTRRADAMRRRVQLGKLSASDSRTRASGRRRWPALSPMAGIRPATAGPSATR